MAKRRKNGSESSRGEAPVLGGHSLPLTPQQAAYARRRIEHPTETKRDSARAAGYSDTTDTCAIESSPALRDLSARIAAARDTTGTTAQWALGRLKQIGDGESARDAVAAIKVATDITGERMPTKVEHSLAMDDQLLDLIDAAGTE